MIKPSDRVEVAAWILEALGPFASGLSSVLPPVFEAYARLLHPSHRVEGFSCAKVRWREVSGGQVRVEATTRFEALEDPGLAEGYETPLDGALDPGDLQRLLEVLAEHSAGAGRCWFCWWEGYGLGTGAPNRVELETGDSPAGPGDSRAAPGFSHAELSSRRRVEVPERPMLLFEGVLADAASAVGAGSTQGPNLWWPDDRSWCVASEIDFRSTYVGGSTELVEALLNHEGLEALPARPTDRVTD